MSAFEQRIIFSIIKNKQLDFALMIFDQIVQIIIYNKRYTHVPYLKWFALGLQYVCTGNRDDQLVY